MPPLDIVYLIDVRHFIALAINIFNKSLDKNAVNPCQSLACIAILGVDLEAASAAVKLAFARVLIDRAAILMSTVQRGECILTVCAP